MKFISKDLILSEIPIFSVLSASERSLIKERMKILEYKKGQVIYRESSPADAFYAIVSGRAVIYTQDNQGKKSILEYLHRGKYFGIISLLTGDSHSVTAQAINDCLVLVINKDDFDFILNKIPRLAIDLSRSLSRRLKRKDIHQKIIFESTIVSVFSSYSHCGKSIYAINMCLSLHKETGKKAILLDILPFGKISNIPELLGLKDIPVFDLSDAYAETAASTGNFIKKSRHGIDLLCLHYKNEDENCLRRVVGILSLLVNDYHYIVLDLPSVMDRAIFNILNQSDLIHILTSPEQIDLKRTKNLIARLQDEHKFEEEKIKVIINEYRYSKLSHEEQVELLGRRVYATLPKIDIHVNEMLVIEEPDSEYAKVIRRITRQLGEVLVGLVLGVGAAYGFCHIGVLKVIEEEDIPVDVVVGSSIGALIASLWVTGKSSDEILEIAQEFKEPKSFMGLLDFTFPRLGFIKGNKLQRFLKKHLGNKTFYDVRLPLKIIASDVKRKEPRIFDKGYLVDAIMATCSMPGVFAPFKIKEEMLFDGGVINPLPTEPLLKMGVKKIIAVNVTPSREDMHNQYQRMKDELAHNISEGLKKKNWFNLKQLFQGVFQNNILDIIFSSIEVLQSEVAQKEAELADVVLHPDTSGMHWLELHRSKEFAKKGEEEARRNLDKIWQLIKE